VEHVFAANNPEQITGKHFLICDDVLTTGATLEAAISKLKNAGNPKISIVTLAVAN
jgi:predicted amidophosphoribosyltransferase